VALTGILIRQTDEAVSLSAMVADIHDVCVIQIQSSSTLPLWLCLVSD